VRITTNQYLAGTVPYLNVITTQAPLLGNEVTLINLQGRRMAAAVLLGKQRPRLRSRASPQVTP
jgi:outer membrane protein TolC